MDGSREKVGSHVRSSDRQVADEAGSWISRSMESHLHLASTQGNGQELQKLSQLAAHLYLVMLRKSAKLNRGSSHW